ncbi:hypothetical protein [Terrarubrum flagellatum]|uniref:hypothetical protein n=1 Tax=Terrirubrum flagellatum TaxID=2895980 RepID=UPI00314528F5
MSTMLILRGNPGGYTWKGVSNWPDGALDDDAAIAYAELRGYSAMVLKVPGFTPNDRRDDGRQRKMALDEINRSSVTALYGFSAGGYNIAYILAKMTKEQKARLKLVVVLGAPGMSLSTISGSWELQYHVDPPQGHMAGPEVFLHKEIKRLLGALKHFVQDVGHAAIGAALATVRALGFGPRLHRHRRH